MTLYLIGLGLHDETDITLKGLNTVKKCSKVFLESYTSKLNCNQDKLEKLYDKKIIRADRDLVENRAEEIIKPAKKEDVALLVVGDPMSATTHTDLMLRAHKAGVKVEIINNTSVLNAVGIVGLELYKYGKTTSIVLPQEGWKVQAHYDVIKENMRRGLHTLCLLDIKQNQCMTIKEALQNLLKIESERKEDVLTNNTMCVGCARLGSPDKKIIAGTAKQLLDIEFGPPLHSIIVPGKLHFIEEEALELWKSL